MPGVYMIEIMRVDGIAVGCMRVHEKPAMTGACVVCVCRELAHVSHGKGQGAQRPDAGCVGAE